MIATLLYCPSNSSFSVISTLVQGPMLLLRNPEFLVVIIHKFYFSGWKHQIWKLFVWIMTIKAWFHNDNFGHMSCKWHHVFVTPSLPPVTNKCLFYLGLHTQCYPIPFTCATSITHVLNHFAVATVGYFNFSPTQLDSNSTMHHS